MTRDQVSRARPAIARNIADLRGVLAGWRRVGETIALVPTMGALHAGHLALVAEARRRADRVVTSIFVNPTQFSPNEDFSTYPRTFERDVALLEEAGCDLVWAPTVEVMYPPGSTTRVVPGGAADGLESDFRPGFFSGVATVCVKLFIQTGADVAIFGEKDYQQLMVVRQVARELDLAIEIVGHPTVRESDGLAMSSRNVNLAPADRRLAAEIPAALDDAVRAIERGGTIDDAVSEARRRLNAAGMVIDYLEVRDAMTLAPIVDGKPADLRILLAGRLGSTRLIDNMAVLRSRS